MNSQLTFLFVVFFVIISVVPIYKLSLTGVTGKNLANTRISSNLPDFWPEKAVMVNISSLNIQWFAPANVSGTIGIRPLEQKHLYYTSHDNVRIHAIYIYPVGNNTLIPGLVLTHGGGYDYNQIYPLGKYLAEVIGMGVLCLDNPGINSDNGAWTSTGPTESAFSCTNIDGVDGARGSFYYHNTLALLRGVTVISSLPGINASCIGIGGFSGGGIASLLANGVESKYQRIAFAIQMAAAGSWTQEFPGKSPVSWYGLSWDSERCSKFLEYYEPLHYAAVSYAPTLLLCITNDQFFDLKQFRLTYEAIPTKKAFSIQIGNNHWFLPNNNTWKPIEAWLQLLITNAKYFSLPQITTITKTSSLSFEITVSLTPDPRFTSVALLVNPQKVPSVTGWNLMPQTLQSDSNSYCWTFNVQNTNSFLVYFSLFNDNISFFSTTPLSASDVEKYFINNTNSSTSWHLLSSLLFASLFLGRLKKRKKITKSF